MKFPILIPNIFNYPFTYESSLKLKTGDYVNGQDIYVITVDWTAV